MFSCLGFLAHQFLVLLGCVAWFDCGLGFSVECFCWEEEPHSTLSLQIWPDSGGAPVCVSVRWKSVQDSRASCFFRILGLRILGFGVVGFICGVYQGLWCRLRLHCFVL